MDSINKKNATDQVRLSGFKKLLFNVILISLPFIILLIIEIFLRIFNYGENYRLFVDFPGHDYSAYRFINPDIGRKYFQRISYNRPCGDMFLKEKPENGFRIFVLGSSTVLGFPYDQNLMFTRILQDRLQDCYPDKKIEVINTAITAINSFTLLDYTDDILKEKPDAILIYAGHNEFYGALGAGSVEQAVKSRNLTILHMRLSSLRLYQLLQVIISNISKKMSDDSKEESAKGTLMKRIAQTKDIAYKSRIYKAGMEFYRKNMQQLLKKAGRKNIPVFLSEVCSNVKDLKPFCSVKTEKYPAALDIYNDALQKESEGNARTAKPLFYSAKDLDCIRFRASEDVNDIIRQLAEKYHAYLIPMEKEYFEKASPDQLIGYNLITEHVHPNISGYFLMADAFFKGITNSAVLGKPNPLYYKSSSYYRKNWGYTELDSLAGVHLVNILLSDWPFQTLESSEDSYRKTYKPVSMIDSLAFLTATSPSINIHKAHLEMADFYMKKGNFYKAFKENYANVKYDPFQINDYFAAIHCLTLTNDFTLALKLLNKSLELKETFYANYIKGEILFLKEDFEGAVKSLGKASALDNSTEAKWQVLNSLYKVYYYGRNENKSEEILKELNNMKPGYKPVLPARMKPYVYYIPIQVEGQVNKAYNFYKSGKFDEAFDIFKESIEIKETSLADRCIGDILFTRNDSNAMLYYEKAYPDYRYNIDFLFNMGILDIKYKKIEKAKKILKEIIHLDPGFKKIPLMEEEIKKAGQ